jgi:hypothetical protein
MFKKRFLNRKNMKCVYCNQPIFIRNLCKKCFIRSFEKRVRKELRGKLRKDSRIWVKNPVCRDFMKYLGMPLKFVRSNYDYEISFWTLDDECESFLTKMFKGINLKVEHSKKNIKLFRTIPEKEVIVYAKLKGFDVKSKTSAERSWLDQISEKFKETKFSLLKSIDEIKSL